MNTIPRLLTPALSVLAIAAGSVSLVATAQDTTARPPAPTLVRPKTPARTTDAAGFLQRWLVLEPIRVTGQLTDSAVQAAVKTEYFSNQLTVIPDDGDSVTVGDARLAWHAVDTIKYNVNLFHFAYALGKPTSNVLFWAVTVVDVPREMSGVRLAIGSNAASVWWLNGEEIISLYNDRQAVIDDGVSKRVTLKEGRNVVRAAIINAGGATDFCARFLDANNNPIKGLTVNLNVKGLASSGPKRRLVDARSAQSVLAAPLAAALSARYRPVSRRPDCLGIISGVGCGACTATRECLHHRGHVAASRLNRRKQEL
jgi:hypothetical protein